jgi:HK97 family phage major capsid protein
VAKKTFTAEDIIKLSEKHGVVTKAVLEKEGFDTGESLRNLSREDMAELKFKMKHGELGTKSPQGLNRQQPKAVIQQPKNISKQDPVNSNIKIQNNNPKGLEPMKTQISNVDLTKVLNTVFRGGLIPQQFQNAITRDEDGAILIPYTLKGDVDAAKKYNKSMRQYVDVIPVKEGKGRYATEDEGNFGEMVELGDSVQITEQDMKFKGVNWELRRYGTFTKVTGELFNDFGFDLISVFKIAHAEKATKTENKLIFNAIRNTLAVKDLTDVRALKTSLNKDLNPALENEITVVTNQDGFELFNKLDSTGNPIKYFENDGPKRYFDIYRFEVYSNEELPSLNGKAPVIYGAVKRVVKLFTSDNLRVLVNSKGNGFVQDTHWIRGIEDYNVKIMPDTTQLIYGEIPLV